MKLQTLRERRARIASGQTSHEANVARALELAATPALAGTFTRLYPQAALEFAGGRALEDAADAGEQVVDRVGGRHRDGPGAVARSRHGRSSQSSTAGSRARFRVARSGAHQNRA